MEILFGDLCSANIFQADKDLHAELGIKNPEGEESQRSTPSPSRDRTKSPTPRPEKPVLTLARTESPRLETDNAPVSRSSSTIRLETPNKRAKTSKSGHGSTPSSTKSEKDARKEVMYKAALNQEWEKGFFTSVDGYHNQGPESEL
jgi:DNA cross-link repair 1C protein